MALGLVFVAGGLAACTPDPSYPPPDPAAAWIGNWSGIVDQPGAGTYAMSIALDNSYIGIEGTVGYPSIPCEGTLTQISASETELVMTETITSGICLDGTWTFTKDGADTILGSWTDTVLTATVTLTRQP